MKIAQATGILVLLLLLIVFSIGCIDNGAQSEVKTTTPPTLTTATVPKTTNVKATTTNVDLHSVYDGTYAGIFKYEYQKRQSLDKNWSEERGPWVAASFSINLTIKTTEITKEQVKMDITNIACSDENFGTGQSGVKPLNGDTWVYLPVNPPTTATNLSGKGMGINVKFPNFSFLQFPTLTRDGKDLPGFLSVSSEGKILSNSLDPAIQNWTWLASTPSGIFLNPSGSGYYQHRFISWTLTRS